MQNHWVDGIKVKEMLLAEKPKFVVEVGAAEGKNTSNLMRMQQELGYKLFVINDFDPAGREVDDGNAGAKWIIGISYLELEKFDDGVIDFCIVDTDHNYPTLKWELAVLTRKMCPGGVVVMHDTVTYGKNNGSMSDHHYNTPNESVPYPTEEIAAANRAGLGMVDAIKEVIDSGAFVQIAHVEERHGATALRRI